MCWIPAILLMGFIFWFSSRPSDNLPNFGVVDWIIKKSGHMTGFGLLSLAYLFGMKQENWKTRTTALLATFLYAISDEYHQSFVGGRHPSPLDVGIDMTGAIIAQVISWISHQRRIKSE